jgi:phage shock protein PspC (stress-responsive transcriptional regulator)
MYRSNDRIIAGVCGGIAEQLGWSANRVRLAYVILSILSAAFPWNAGVSRLVVSYAKAFKVMHAIA